MNLPADFIESIRNRLNLSEVVGQTVKLKKQGREHVGLCPFHKEKSPSFGVNDSKGVYYCFGCGAGGDMVAFVRETKGLGFVEAITELAKQAGLALPQQVIGDEGSEARKKHEGLYKLVAEVVTWFQKQLLGHGGKTAQKYLQSRGLSKDTTEIFELGFAPPGNALKKEFLARGYSEREMLEAGLLARRESDGETYDRFRGRIIFPIKDRRGRAIAFGGRALGDGKPKYLNSPETPLFDKGRNLYALYQAQDFVRQGHQIVVVEGYMDVITLYQNGYKGAVAPLGTAITEEQIQQLWKICPEPTLCLDGDEAGGRAAARTLDRSLPILGPGLSLRFAQLPKGEDPDSLVRSGSTDILASCLENAQSLIDFLWQKEVASKRMDTPEQRALVRRNTFNLLKNITDKSVSYLYQQEIGQRFFNYFRNQRVSRHDRHAQSFGGTSGGIHTLFDPLKRQRYILFAILINRPTLIHKVGEQFATIDLPEPELFNLREEIFCAINYDMELDSEALKYHLINKGYQEIMTQLLCEDVYVHAFFARPASSESDALLGWSDIMGLLQNKRDMKCEEDQMIGNMMQNLSTDTWMRFHNLKKHTLLNE